MTIFTVPAAHLDSRRNTAEDLRDLATSGDIGPVIYFLDLNGTTRAVSSYGRFLKADLGDHPTVKVSGRHSGTARITGILDVQDDTLLGALPTGKVSTYVAK